MSKLLWHAHLPVQIAALILLGNLALRTWLLKRLQLRLRPVLAYRLRHTLLLFEVVRDYVEHILLTLDMSLRLDIDHLLTPPLF